MYAVNVVSDVHEHGYMRLLHVLEYFACLFVVF